MASATTSVASVHSSMIRSLRSSSVMRPRSYSRSMRCTRSSYPARISSLFSGMTMSFFEIVIPARVACANPSSLIVSRIGAIERAL